MLKRMLFVFVLFLYGSLALASGFSIYEQSNRATGMAGAVIAHGGDASMVFYNPAAITALNGTHILLGSTIITTDFAFTGPANLDDKKYTEADKGFFPPAHFYATHALNERFSIGAGFYSLFGLSSRWGSDSQPWLGRQLTTYTNLRTFFFNPVLAVQLPWGFSLAAGAEIVRGDVQMDKDVYYTPRNVFGKSSITGDAMGYGFNLALHYRPLDNLSFGVTYRSNVTLDFNDGTAEFTFPDTGDDIINQEIASVFPRTTAASASLKLPAMAGVGVAFWFTKNLSFEADYLWSGWSSYDKLVVEFDQAVAGETRNVSERRYEDTYSLRFGMEYRIDESWTLRSGYLYDRHAVPEAYVEPSLPEGDRHNYSIGLGYNWQNITVDAAYQILLQDDREITNSVQNFNGKYSGLANIFGMTIGYAF